jgi:hypothetical protein
MRAKREQQPTARFWIMHPHNVDGFVRLTLRPGQSVAFHRGKPDSEGFTASAERYRYDISERVIRRECASWGSDCDGRYKSFSDDVCPLDQLATVPVEWNGETINRPNWQQESASQRDYTAEAMNY